jgi:hypothetical protein
MSLKQIKILTAIRTDNVICCTEMIFVFLFFMLLTDNFICVFVLTEDFIYFAVIMPFHLS